MKTHKGLRLYNVIFPIWMLVLLPMFTWWLVLPLNLAVDFAVLYFSARYIHIQDPFSTAMRAIVRVWLLGFAADFVGAAGMFAGVYLNDLEFLGGGEVLNELAYSLSANPFESLYGFLWTAVCVAVTGGLIYVLNRAFGLKKLGLPERENKKIALCLAVFTAPYLFFVPAELFYR